MRQLRERPFLFLLIALLLFVVVYPILHESVGSRELYDGLRTLLLLAALRVVFVRRRQLIPAVGLAAFLVLGVGIGYVSPERMSLPLVFILHAAAIVFFLLAIGSILWAVYVNASVSADSVAGALCAYMLLGVVFAHGYWFIQTAVPGAFRGDGEFGPELADPKQSLFPLTYYSFVTLASVGANDISPVRPAARGLTMLEAICGQFFIAVLIADLIGKKIASAPTRAGPGESSFGSPNAPDHGSQIDRLHEKG